MDALRATRNLTGRSRPPPTVPRLVEYCGHGCCLDFRTMHHFESLGDILEIGRGLRERPDRILIREAIVFSYSARGSERSVGGHADQNHLRNLRGVREPPYGSGVSGNIVDTVAVWISGRCTILKIWPASLKLVGGVRERPDRILIREAIHLPTRQRNPRIRQRLLDQRHPKQG